MQGGMFLGGLTQMTGGDDVLAGPDRRRGPEALPVTDHAR
jgi:hypothetical protein